LKQPVQFTTRQQRTKNEVDDYVFLSKRQYLDKLGNGDFAEFTEFDGNFYAISRGFYNESSDNEAISKISSRDPRLRL